MENKHENEVKALKVNVALNVSDVKKSTEFYGKMLGLKPMKERIGYAKFDVQNPPLNLTLNQVAEVGKGRLSHLGIQVSSTHDVYATKQKCIEPGLLKSMEMKKTGCIALQNKTWVKNPM